ncbi:DUF72 domain-containing protein [Sphingomonas sp. JC676]|uniref:DUF72 domain-containing protein n=1 Tax=Sphingomonas sp. JC676 TaxID=2768065 RepID=UPI001657A54D|nr:DUF72 domain-containing protein [Sphingomonas sp. JC676]MBC9032464.1 DUF72 domain-containing protein [Sphingomonas sp. JC676]
MTRIRTGTAAWALPSPVRDRFPPAASNLERYAGRFDATEINSSFYRPHRPATYARWAASVPEDFRFSVKLPRTITHEARLRDCKTLVERFAAETAALGAKRGPVLVQLPPRLAFDTGVVGAFFALLTRTIHGPIVCEPRHPSWFDPDAEALLIDHRVARVAADPAPVPAAALPGGWPGLAYFRLHGSPRPYWSSYDQAALDHWATLARATGAETWVIFDNTASGAATANALEFGAR